MAASNPSPLAKYKLVSALAWVSGGGAVYSPAAGQEQQHCCATTLNLPQVFLGDQSVGKTSIITRFMYDKFDNTYQVGQRP